MTITEMRRQAKALRNLARHTSLAAVRDTRFEMADELDSRANDLENGLAAAEVDLIAFKEANQGKDWFK